MPQVLVVMPPPEPSPLSAALRRLIAACPHDIVGVAGLTAHKHAEYNSALAAARDALAQE